MPQGAEWLIILAIVILLFGSAMLPTLVRQLGRSADRQIGRSRRSGKRRSVRSGRTATNWPRTVALQARRRRLRLSNHSVWRPAGAVPHDRAPEPAGAEMVRAEADRKRDNEPPLPWAS
ncbi:twin-arginine translocase TatA/TatE family subunit [Kribbella sp. NBC_01505]|uniref:twin-arginine translocase TatA/TatE family subunit n=1 Tax=Kribbella sp. NBC_01505 TaxID=2903580 RepID=UPI003866C282